MSVHHLGSTWLTRYSPARMWALDNRTPFAAERAMLRDPNGRKTWVVVVKGTYTIEKGRSLVLAGEQDKVSLAPEFFGDPSTSSLRWDTDLVVTKPGTDVLLHGCARGPKGRASRAGRVRLRVADRIDKTVEVYGDRIWQGSLGRLTPSSPALFTEMPLRYERAYGGLGPLRDDGTREGDRRNPVGRGFAPVENDPVPNLEAPDAPLSEKKNARPAGFGPVPGHWLPRCTFVGTYDQRWEQDRKPFLPADFSPRYYCCAPLDQQVPGHLPLGAVITVTGVRSEGTIEVELTQKAPTFVSRVGTALKEHDAKLHTVSLDTETLRLNLIWQTALDCQDDPQPVWETTVHGP